MREHGHPVLDQEQSTGVKTFSWVQWLLITPALLIGYCALEWVADRFVSLPFWKGMPSWARVLLLGTILGVLFIAIVVVVQHIRSA